MIKEIDQSKYIENVNYFLYRFIFLSLIINFFLYLISSEVIAIILYILLEIYLFFCLKKLLKDSFASLFALLIQVLIVSLISLTYLTFILTALLNNFLFDTTISEILFYDLYCDLDSYFLANIYLLFFSLSLLLFNSFIPKALIIMVTQKINLLNFFFPRNKISILIILCISFELFLFISGIAGTQRSGGFMLEGDDKSTWYTQLTYFINMFHIFLNILYLTRNNNNLTFFEKCFLLISITISFVSFGYYQRRNIVIFFVTNFFLYFIMTNKKVFTFKNSFIYSFAFIIVFQSFVYLGTIRKIKIIEKETSLIQTFKSGEMFSFLKDDGMKDFGTSLLQENLRERMMNNHELATLFFYKRQKRQNFLYGQYLLRSFIQVVPAVFIKNKQNYIPGDDFIGTITNSPLYEIDTIDSIHSASYADFGIFGLIIYPIIINLVIFFTYKIIMIKKLLKTTALFIVAIYLPIFTIRIIEANLLGIFVIFRNIIIFTIFFNFVLSYIEKNKLNKY
jgi:hypothetical protein